MAEYIERDAAIRALLNDSPEQVGYSREDAADCIRYMDAADVAPVRHGRWINHTMIDGHIHAECSECHKVRIIDNFCPNCGAKMDLEEEQHELRRDL